MAPESVELSIPFDSLVDYVTKLHLWDKFWLWELLDEQMADVKEEMWGEDPAVQAEIREARAAYQAGDYITIDRYIAGDAGTTDAISGRDPKASAEATG